MLTRTSTKAFAEFFYMELMRNPDRKSTSYGAVRGSKQIKLKFSEGTIPLEFEVKGTFGNENYQGSDAGIMLDGPGQLGILMVRVPRPGSSSKHEYLLRLIDKRLLLKHGETTAKWWAANVQDGMKAEDVLLAVGAAARVKFQRVNGEWIDQSLV
jgi:hypothetical protein